MLVGGLVDPVFGPLISVGIGGVLTEMLDDVVFAPAPVTDRGRGDDRVSPAAERRWTGFRGAPAGDVEGLALIVSLVSRGITGPGLREVEINPLIWDGEGWVAVDWLVVHERGDPLTEETTSSGT